MKDFEMQSARMHDEFRHSFKIENWNWKMASQIWSLQQNNTIMMQGAPVREDESRDLAIVSKQIADELYAIDLVPIPWSLSGFHIICFGHSLVGLVLLDALRKKDFVFVLWLGRLESLALHRSLNSHTSSTSSGTVIVSTGVETIEMPSSTFSVLIKIQGKR